MREDFHKEALSKRILNRCKRNFDSFAFVFLLVLVMAAMMDSTSAFVTRKHKYALRRLKHVSILHAKKPSMAQRRKNRAKRLQQHANPYSRLPPPKIRADHKDAGISKNEALQTTSSLEETDSKAKQLLRSQRESVKMLTLIRERVELLDELALVKALDDKGYIYIDNFLKSSDIVTKIELEGKSLFENELMQADMDAIGLGEYMTSIQGGQDQYKQCPRSIEFIVSTTKHFPGDHLDKTKTMANMRTFSRKSWLASVQLLTGKNESYSEPEAPWKPFRTRAGNMAADCPLEMSQERL
ncbi:hypothetical protein MPSEU_000854000 [Mayamaea pseudoterrestris]|nr:hypothetical protein MPSEU_000854000 [Mayamaea pseudoterrestris]